MTHETFDISFSSHPAGLKAWVRGPGTLDNTLAYWRDIEAELRRRPGSALLLVDEMRGAALSEEQWRQVVATMQDGPLEQARIAHVKPNGLQTIEYCELFAVEAGICARVFTNEAEAVMWLRHGLR